MARRGSAEVDRPVAKTAAPATARDSAEPVLRVVNMRKYFPGKSSDKPLKAVDGVSFELFAGETLGLVGESGCGKSTTGRAVLQLHRPSSGRVWLDDIELTSLGEKELRKLRPRMQMIFQDSYASLNPRHTVGRIIGEPMRVHTEMTTQQVNDRVVELLDLVGLRAAHRTRYPHEFSGGQRQRINIARALSLSPDLIVCDEPISALDVSIQAQTINLFADLQDEFGIAYLFVAHDLSMVEHISDRVAVMYLGHIRRTRPDRDSVRGDASPVHAGLAVGSSDTRSRGRGQSDPCFSRRGGSESCGTTTRLRVLDPLPLGCRPLSC